MNSSLVMDIMQQALLVILKISLPLLGISMIVGLIIAIFQAATQIHEQTLTFVPKLVTVAFLLIIMGSFIISIMTEFITYIFSLMTKLT
ncbi:flagellar biosynthesis protein FliQ [Sedimentibacter sp. zth1]|uniref:flagellar biosynthesis protein FliQ n=1 Tax=Sedimentibacter sp. zth1 TaxID=2816908 RepID=UPI001A928950|nr:flagellar biosynthesis protein FliQ [Sedimentibacter sp. zth1]QSX07186.1 flagellar biosynthesis protein FliQ [Sedimentibacter sp. zth1]